MMSMTVAATEGSGHAIEDEQQQQAFHRIERAADRPV
jgi:hypothetical protein